MSPYESTVVRRVIEEHEPIKDVDLNFRLVAEGIDPHDAIVLEDILEEQGRIKYDPESRCFETITRSA